ncbi:hypothetical protein EZV62_003035 [Acer yangbiense]|uniref:Glycosyltransferase n=1 Tax=Acer yangbiense TaxID=1000413 RepID=A0A5C7J1B7_9ROSI|nr:hypothetical protein EZV62_003035 [Acer yangbiense]
MINNVCHIVAMPYPAKGHSNPMMNLCKLLASKRQDMLITYVTEETYTSSGTGNFPPKIRFSYIPKVDAGHRRNIPVAAFWISTATEFSMQCHLNLFKEKQFPTDLEEHANDVVDFIPGISPIRVSDLPRFFLKNGQSIALDAWTLELPISKVQYVVCPSVYELESHVLDFLRSKFDFRIYPFGPLIPYFELNNNKPTSTPDYIEWLSSQPRSSVLYVAMGSIASLSSDQTDEMAAGLRSSGVRYLWVGRENTSRLKELCGELGLVVPWCDQMRVLSHSSVGGFLTHCGLSSIIEGGFSGVPMLTFPIAGDQFPNGKLVVEDWKVGWRLKKDLLGGNKLITREAITETVHKFMDINGSERGELTERSKEFQQILKGAAAKGGSSDANLEAFIKDITQAHTH